MNKSLIWQQDFSIEEFIASLLDHFDATLFIDRRTGLWELKLIRADYSRQHAPRIGHAFAPARHPPLRQLDRQHPRCGAAAA